MNTKVDSSLYTDEVLSSDRRRGFVASSSLALLAFATAFFPRVIAALGIPAAVNFLHFITIPFASFYVLSQSRTRDYRQIALAQGILFGLGALLAVITASALVNSAGVINVVLDFLLLGEPFVWMLAIAILPLSASRLDFFRTWWMRFGLINVLFGLIQAFVLRLNLLNADHIKGVFIGQGSGHVVGGAVSLAFAVFYYATAQRPVWIRVAILLAAIVHLVVADAKQVFAVFLAALCLLIFLKAQNLSKLMQYLVITALFVVLLIVAANTVFHALLTWFDLEIQQQGMELKLSVFSILPTFYKSFLNWLFGLGPGHTVSRLGGWLVWDYKNLLDPLGVTRSQASVAVWRVTGQSWLGDRSSWFSPLFGWAGIWGDLGVVGLGVYVGLWVLVWQKVCYDDLSK
ncbi:MAG TPA: hypothetical protein V6C65_16635, partial [Allocoleopsis sp.]